MVTFEARGQSERSPGSTNLRRISELAPRRLYDKKKLLARRPNVTALPGGVAFKFGDEIIGGLGVGGSPGGDKDEACAQAGVAKVAELLKR